jgi:DNA polymerase I-like protein with 3'-5' exonuclease and polymerase domains
MIFPPSMGFDLETMGDLPEYALQPFRAETGKAGIKAASIAVKDQTAGLLYPEVEKVRRMLLKAIRDDLYVVGWNTAFDAAWCIAVGLEPEVFQVKWLDAMLLWRHAVVEPEGEDVPRPKRKSYSLASAMHEFYPDQAGFKDFEDFQATDEQSLDLLLYRNEQDALWTLRLAEKFWGMLNDQQIRAALIEARCIPMIAKTRVMGIVSSADAAQDLADKLATEAISIYRQLLKDAPEVQGINLGSPKQLQALLYETWGLMPARFSRKTKLPSTDKYALFDLAAIDPRASMLKKLREAKNNRTKYAKGTINSLAYNGDGRVRPQAKIFSTYTSRITYGSSDKATEEVEKTTKKLGTVKSIRKCEVPVGVALHQWKRGKEYRRLIMAPPGYMLCEFDFAGQEFRWMAVASGDETMLSLCAPGEDAHGFMGARVASCDYRELVAMVKSGDADAAFKRKAGKFCNLSYQYRVSARTATTKARVEYELDVDEIFIKQTQSIYRQAYVGVGGHPGQRNGGYWGRQIEKCKRMGFAETFAGRRVQLVGNWAGKEAWPLESTAINYPIQGTGGDQKYLALAVLRNILPKYGAHFYYELHDGVFTIVPSAKIEVFFLDARKQLSTLPYKQAWMLEKDFPIEFPVDGKVGPTWGDLYEPDWE